MFDLAWSEIALIGVVALVVIGPKDLPEAIRGVARGVQKLRRMASEFQGQADELVREANLDEVRPSINEIRNFNVRDTLERRSKGRHHPQDLHRRSAEDGLHQRLHAAGGEALAGREEGVAADAGNSLPEPPQPRPPSSRPPMCRPRRRHPPSPRPSRRRPPPSSRPRPSTRTRRRRPSRAEHRCPCRANRKIPSTISRCRCSTT